MPVQRLPVYSRADHDLLHWAGKVLIPAGQMITPDLVAALVDAGIDYVYLEGAKRVRTDNLEEIDIYAIQEDAPLPYSIFDREGNLLAREGERLTTDQVDSLHRRGQKKIYYYKSGPAGHAARFEASYIARVRSRLDEQVIFGRRREKARTGLPISRFARVFSGRPRPPHVLARSETCYRRWVETLAAMWARLADGGYIRNNELAPFVNDILERFLNDADLFAALAFGQPGLDVFPEHSVATAVYSLFVARQLGYNRLQARDLIAAALFHDVGYILIPKALLEAERSLTKGERRIIFRHIEHALFLTGRVDWPGEDFRIGIYQHRERGTGAGYPSGYRANRIHEYAKIVGIADVFHALVSDRPHRKAYGGSEAMNMV
ncbi:MAG: HD-GYP domain-containing protein, partial [Planctomycetota bacterium]